MGFVTVWVANFCFILPLMHSEIIPNPRPLIIARFTIFAPMNRLSGAVCLSPGSGRPHRAIPKGNASPKGLPPRKESISEWIAIPKGNASQKGPQSRKETHPPGEKNCNVMLESLGLFGLFIGVMLSATLVPFSSDALYVGALLIGKTPVVLTLLVATAGSWAGAMITYYLGRFAKWEWLVKHFDVKVETLEKQKVRIDRYGVWLSALCWTPFFGEAVMIALGFYKCRPLPIYLLTLAGVFVRYVVWTLVLV